MQIDVVFEETGEHIDVRFHSLLRDPDAVRSVNGIKPDENGNVEIDAGNTIIGSGAPPFDPGNTEIEAGQFYYDQAKGHLWLCIKKGVEDSGNGAPPTGTIEWANLDWFNVKSVNGNYPDENGNVEIPIGGGTAEGAKTPLIVTLDLPEATSDTSPADILNALQNGRYVYGRLIIDEGDDSSIYVPLIRCNEEGYAQFGMFGDDYYDYIYEIFPTCDIRTVELITPSYEEFYGELGDISTALDHILALQEALIGGDSQ